MKLALFLITLLFLSAVYDVHLLDVELSAAHHDIEFYKARQQNPFALVDRKGLVITIERFHKLQKSNQAYNQIITDLCDERDRILALERK